MSTRVWLAILVTAHATHAQADILLVPDMFPTIQAASDAAVNGDEIHIAPGVYAGADIFAEDVRVRGLGPTPASTVLTGLLRCYESIEVENIHFNAGARFDVFPTTVTDCRFSSVGLEIDNSGVTFTRCVFINCAGTAVQLELSPGIFDDCDFIGNTSGASGGGAISVDNTRLTITNCRFFGNISTASGGAINASTFAADLSISDSVFEDNIAAGLGGAIRHDTNGGSVTLEDCSFVRNTSLSAEVSAVEISDSTDSFTCSVTGCTFEENISPSSLAGASLRFDSDNIASPPTLGTSMFCGNVPGHVLGGHTDLGTNSFSTLCICLADVNGDGMVTPSDFNAWIDAFNNNLPGCDQNQDGQCTPSDFNAWIANFNAGC